MLLLLISLICAVCVMQVMYSVEGNKYDIGLNRESDFESFAEAPADKSVDVPVVKFGTVKTDDKWIYSSQPGGYYLHYTSGLSRNTG